MNVQKLGLVLGINMAAACLMMQGCKAKNGGRNVRTTTSSDDRIVTVVSRPAPKPQPKTTAPSVVEPDEVPGEPIVVAPVATKPSTPKVKPLPPPKKPSAVATVKPLPPAKKPSAVANVKPLPGKPVDERKPLPSEVKTAAAPAAATADYVVKPGDTLFIISKRTNYRIGAILAANPGLKPDRIRAGQKIKLPGAVADQKTVAAAPDAKTAGKKPDGKVMPAAAPAPAAANTSAPVKTKAGFVKYEGPTKEYTVKSGDSLGKIAMESGISIRALKTLNGLKKDNLRIGQKIKVPAEKQVSGQKAAVKADSEKGAPSADGVAAKKTDAVAKKPEGAAKKAEDQAKKAEDQVKKAEDAAKTPAADNGAAADAAADAQPPADAAKAEGAEAPVDPKPAAEVPSGPTHTVKQGEDLVSIAIAYGISPSALMDANNLSVSSQIQVGQVLKLPANANK